MKKIKKDEKDMSGHQSDGEKSDQDLVVDDASEINPLSPLTNQHAINGTSSPRENGGMMVKKFGDHTERDRMSTINIAAGGMSSGIPMAGGSHSPRSGTSSNASTPSNKKNEEKPATPIAKSVTPSPSNQVPTNGIPSMSGPPGTPGASSPLVKSVPKPPVLNAGAYPPYLGQMNGGPPHDLQAAAYNLPHGFGPRGPLQVGFEPHPQMRAPPISGIPGGKP